ncbi:MAG: RsmB/NOP family class I SAM-dependent RNA methyltransferase [Clostridia bacterium]|nr:RsmB/NOP family class I SAM-dependent RNA methyltransferase [Clostridia bacterium]
MLSINDIKRRLPQDFVEELYESFSPLTVDKILQGMTDDRYLTLRVNTLKYNIQDLMRLFKEKNIKFERVPYYSDSLIIKNVKEKEIQKLDIYEKGYVYFQSLSSMVPPLVLGPKPGEKVLDMTSAPGSKTTQMACMMKNEGYILANELDKIRCERLKYNVKMQGASIVEVINGRGEKLGDNYEGQFDKVLLDAPCSGEGRFVATNPMTYRGWSKKTVNDLVKLQKKLFLSGFKALKPGGFLVYSTCTINKDENEFILDWALKNLDVKLENIDIEIKDAIPGFNEGLDKDINKSIKILPSKFMEGFFVSKFVKNSG